MASLSSKALDSLLNGIFQLLLVIGGDLVLDFLGVNRTLQTVAIVLESVLGFDAVLVGIILSLVLLGFLNHSLNLVLRQTSLVVGE